MNNEDQYTPPRWAQALLRWRCPPEDLEAVEGDLLELYRHWVDNIGVRKARWRYILNAVRLQRPLSSLKLEKIQSSPLIHGDMFRHFTIVAFRNLVRNRSISLINIFGLAFGLASSLLIMLWVRDEQRVDRFHSNSDVLYRVYITQRYNGETISDYYTPAALPAELKKNIPEIEYASGYVKYFRLSLQDDIYESFSVGDKTYKLKGSRAHEDIFLMFSYRLLYGRPGDLLSRPESLCVSRKMAEMLFGSVEAAVGKTVRFDGRKDLVVTGVFEDVPPNSSDQFDYLMNWDAWVAESPLKQRWGHFGTSTYIRLRHDAHAAAVEEKIRNFLNPYLGIASGEYKVELGLQPFADQYLYSSFENGRPSGGRVLYVRLFIGVAFFIFLIACINFTNLATVRSVKRAKEIGVRKVVGSSRSHLVFQFIGETMVLSCIAAFLSLVLIGLVLPAFNSLTGKKISLSPEDPSNYVILFWMILVTGLIAGTYPAFMLSALKPVRILKGYFRFGVGATYLRKALVVFQFVISMLLLISTVVISQQIHFIQNKNLGYDREGLLYIPIEGQLASKYQLFREEASKLPGIKMIDRCSQFPHATSHRTTGVEWQGRDPNSILSFAASSVGYDFVKLMNLEIVQGRGFMRGIKSDSVSFLINEEARKQIGLANPIGLEITVYGKKGPIIGVIRNYHSNTLHQAIEPVILDVKEHLEFGTVLVRTEKGRVRDAIESLAKAYRMVNPNHAFSYSFMDQQYDELYKSEQLVAKLSYLFSCLAIVISCLGLLGLSMFAAEQWKKQIGIRKVFGATLSHVVAMFSGDFLRLVLLSVFIAVPIAWLAMSRWLAGFAYHVELSWWMFALAASVVLLVSMITVSTQAVRAALENPVKNLRTE